MDTLAECHHWFAYYGRDFYHSYLFHSTIVSVDIFSKQFQGSLFWILDLESHVSYQLHINV